jgi:hypothetical protein
MEDSLFQADSESRWVTEARPFSRLVGDPVAIFARSNRNFGCGNASLAMAQMTGNGIPSPFCARVWERDGNHCARDAVDFPVGGN